MVRVFVSDRHSDDEYLLPIIIYLRGNSEAPCPNTVLISTAQLHGAERTWLAFQVTNRLSHCRVHFCWKSRDLPVNAAARRSNLIWHDRARSQRRLLLYPEDSPLPARPRGVPCSAGYS